MKKSSYSLLRKLRYKLKLTQEQFAKECGVPQSNISYYELHELKSSSIISHFLKIIAYLNKKGMSDIDITSFIKDAPVHKQIVNNENSN